MGIWPNCFNVILSIHEALIYILPYKKHAAERQVLFLLPGLPPLMWFRRICVVRSLSYIVLFWLSCQFHHYQQNQQLKLSINKNKKNTTLKFRFWHVRLTWQSKKNYCKKVTLQHKFFEITWAEATPVKEIELASPLQVFFRRKDVD